MLQGYKTYILAALIAGLTILHSLSRIDDATYQTLLTLLSAGTASTLAAKVNRLSDKVR